MNWLLGAIPFLWGRVRRAIYPFAVTNSPSLAGTEELLLEKKEFLKILCGARSSPLSRAQFEEVANQLALVHPEIILKPVWVDTVGDKDRKTSLRTLEKSNFFTKELDEMVLSGAVRVAIHSAKDLPEPLPDGLSLVAITKGIDSRDSLVLKQGAELRSKMTVATSSERREDLVRQICPDAQFTDLRGTIGERLQLLESGAVDGVVVAEAALIRLRLTHLNRIILFGEVAPLQGKLAIIAATEDCEMRALFLNHEQYNS